MAINVSTLKTDLDAVSDLIEAEADTDAHYTAMVVACRADLNTMIELNRLSANVDKLRRALGIGSYQPVVDPLVV